MNRSATPIDHEIRDLITELSKVGIKTVDSCAGHARPGHNPAIKTVNAALKGENKIHPYYLIEYMGHIDFDINTYNSSLAKKIMRGYGLTGLKELFYYGGKKVGIVFNPIGCKYTPNRGIGVMWRI